jgi:hypothetical protein
MDHDFDLGQPLATDGTRIWFRPCHYCAIDGMSTAGEDGQVHFAEADTLSTEDLAAMQ